MAIRYPGINIGDVTEASWGNISGDIDNQLDLVSELDNKSDITHNHDGVYEPANNNIQNHISSTSNPHSTTKTQVGLGNVDDVQQLPMSYLDTDGTLSSNSDSKVPSQKAVKTYVDGKVETVNVETLSGDKTLTLSDAVIQILNPNGANRNITLPTSNVPTGRKFIIINSATNSYYLVVTNLSDNITGMCQKTYIYNGSAWKCYGNDNIAIGYNAYNNYNSGIGIGYNAYNNYNSGIGIGYNAYNNFNGGIGIGYNAFSSHSKATAIGYYAQANGKGEGTIALGSQSYAVNNREITSSSSSDIDNFSAVVVQKFKYKDLNSNSGAWQELFVDGTSARMAVSAKTLYNFYAQVNAIDKTNYNSKTWELKGAIKRDASNNTSLVGSITKNVVGADAATTNWDVQFTADDTNETLKVEVKHDSSNQVRFTLNIFMTRVGV